MEVLISLLFIFVLCFMVFYPYIMHGIAKKMHGHIFTTFTKENNLQLIDGKATYSRYQVLETITGKWHGYDIAVQHTCTVIPDEYSTIYEGIIIILTCNNPGNVTVKMYKNSLFKKRIKHRLTGTHLDSFFSFQGKPESFNQSLFLTKDSKIPIWFDDKHETLLCNEIQITSDSVGIYSKHRSRKTPGRFNSLLSLVEQLTSAVENYDKEKE